MSPSLRSVGMVTVVVCVLGVGTVAAQVSGQRDRDAVDQTAQLLLAASNGKARIERSAETGLARFVGVSTGPGIPVPGQSATTAAAKARAFLSVYGQVFGLGRTPETKIVKVHRRDAVGMEHVRFQQTHRGVPVTGAELIVHLKDSYVVAANGRLLDYTELLRLAVSPSLKARQALIAVRALMKQALGVNAPRLSPPRLEVFNRALFDGGRSPSRLAWFVEARAPRVLEYVWVDAQTGAILLHFNQQPDVRDRHIYTASNGTSLPGTEIQKEGEPDTGDADADAAYRYAGDTYDYFFTRFDRDSLDGAGQSLILTVHYGSNYQNAFWDPYSEQMAFGDGVAQADDVVAHEITHGVTQHTANLYYYKQSGALNESVSDIFGETVDLQNGAGTDTPEVRWLAAEDWIGTGPIRNMSDPNAMGDPGKVSDPQLACGEFDNGGVHTNSGILNHAYALAVDGGNYNGRSVAGVGLEKGGTMMYRALTTYLTTSSDFWDANTAIRQSCTDLVGTNGITTADCEDLGRALDAVEIAADWPCAEPELPSVAVTKSGNATGTVTSDPPGIHCGSICEVFFPEGSHVNLMAAPDPDTVFAGWGGRCRGVGSCDVMVESREHVSATFDVIGTTHVVSVTTSGTGTVTSSPAGIDCGTTCEAAFPSGTVLKLSATAPAGYALQAWGGDCTGRGLCTLTIDGLKAVTATFAEAAFAESNALQGVRAGRASWGDYDADHAYSALDLVVVGQNGARPATVYHNEIGIWTFVDSQMAIDGGGDFAAWGDYDNDGDLDLVVGGWRPSPPGYVTRLYRNDNQGSAFVEVPAPFVGVGMGAQAAWGDYDNDGDLDLGIAGYDGQSFATKIYRNDHGAFVDTNMALTGVYYCDVAWADYDNDGDLDLAVGGGSSSGYVTIIYRNDNGTFVDIQAGLPGIGQGSIAWADYDNDGDLDLAISGSTEDSRATRIYRNDGGVFVDIHAPLVGVYDGSAVWGDYDGDGLVDLLVTGMTVTDSSETTKLYHNDVYVFSEVFTGLPDLYASNAAWGDYDDDGRLDVALLGVYPARETDTYVGVYRNLSGQQNTSPQPPGGTTATVNGNAVRLDWHRATDTQTPSKGLSYNVRVGTTSGGSEIVSPMADGDGHGRVVRLGNAGENTSLFLRDLAPGYYFWAVQAIDSSFARSQFSDQRYFRIPPTLSVNDVSVIEGNAGTTQAVFIVALSNTTADNVTVDYTTASGTAIAPGDYTTTSGTLTIWYCDTSATFAVPVVGDTVDEPDETFTVSLSNPVNATIADGQAVGTILNDDAAPTLSVNDVSVAEGNGGTTNAVFTVTLSAASGHTTTVDYATAPGTATAPADYTTTSGTLTIAAGSTSATFAVPVVGDTVYEPDETFTVNLSNAVNTTIADAQGVGTILNDDAAPTLSVNDVSVTEGNSGTTNAVFTLTLSAPSGCATTVDYATAPGTAIAPGDFTATSGTLTIPAGDTSATVAVPVVGDTLRETNEFFTVNLSNPTNAVIADAQGRGTIIDDDATVPKLSINNVTATEGNSGLKPLTFTVTLSAASASTVTVKYATANGTAVAGSDYQATSGTLTFAPGDLTKDVVVNVIGDTVRERMEGFTVKLTNPTNATIYVATGKGTISNDD